MSKYVNSRRHASNRTNVYHTSKECHYLRDGHRVVSEEYANRVELRECKRCAGTSKPPTGRSAQCPFCGEVITKSYAKHLPCEESP